MNKLTFSPKEFDDLLSAVMVDYIDVVAGHLPCICKKKQHKACLRHNGIAVMKMVYNNRQPIGDKILHSQLTKNNPEGIDQDS